MAELQLSPHQVVESMTPEERDETFGILWQMATKNEQMSFIVNQSMKLHEGDRETIVREMGFQPAKSDTDVLRQICASLSSVASSLETMSA